MFHGVYVGLARASLQRVRDSFGPRSALREARYLAYLSSQHFPRGNWYRFRACETIVPSYFQVTDTCRSHLLERSRVHVVPNGVDAQLFSPRAHTARARPLLVAGGRLYRNKGFDVAIRAMRRLDADLVITGDGEERASLERLAADLGVTDKVTFAGTIPLHDLVELVASADAYLFLTVEYEASGLAQLEAMSCGVPLVASDISAVREAVNRPGENGLIVKRGDDAELARAVDRLLRDEGLRRRMGLQARQRMATSRQVVYEVECVILA